MSRREEPPKVNEIPDIIRDVKNKKQYAKGKFLGKGGFAKCYELQDMETKHIFAGKIVSKSALIKPSQKEKMTQEIAIHRSMKHQYVVGFHGYFEDNDNIYILLELCRRRSLMELHKRRKFVTEPEARYFLGQIIAGCQYLHSNKIIHRDLKLGNLFLNEDMVVKLGDFGLATRVDFVGERKKTLCGTPNYIAPEVLTKRGHSYEVDSWSLGCIMYTLLVGRPPFETQSLKDTYSKIRRNEYNVPPRVSAPAASLIRRLLSGEPDVRPKMADLLHDEFFASGYHPGSLPTSSLTMVPRFDNIDGVAAAAAALPPSIGVSAPGAASRRVLGDVNARPTAKDEHGAAGAHLGWTENAPPVDYHLSDLYAQVVPVAFAEGDPAFREVSKAAMEEQEDPASIPIYWISKWVDYSDKYGLGYQLCDNSVGVLFNDSSRLLLTVNNKNLQYYEKDGTEHLYTKASFPQAVEKKVTLLNYFQQYMQQHLLKAGADMVPRESDGMARLPFLRFWFRTRNAIILHLSNGTLQINFFKDHTKLILCPLMGAVTYIDEAKEFSTYRFSSMQRMGISADLATRLNYAKAMIERLSSSRSGTAGMGRATVSVNAPEAKPSVAAS